MLGFHMNRKEDNDYDAHEKIVKRLAVLMRFLIGLVAGTFISLALMYRYAPAPRGFFAANPHLSFTLTIALIFGIVLGILLNTIWKHY